MKKVIVAYVPVLHQGYVELFNRHPKADIVLLSSESAKKIDETIADQLSRDKRCVKVELIQQTLESVFLRKAVVFEGIQQLKKYNEIIMPNEKICHLLANHVMAKQEGKCSVITYDDPFLRHDWSGSPVLKEVVGKYPFSTDQFDRFAMDMARGQAGNSSDFWRQVGAVVPKDKESMLCASYNEHMPTPMTPYVEGDIRLNMKPGESPEVCGAIHAEASLIAQAAREGYSLKGKSIYVTTFPCPNCARAIVVAGLKRVFFQNGYSRIDAEEIFREANIEVFQVK